VYFIAVAWILRKWQHFERVIPRTSAFIRLGDVNGYLSSIPTNKQYFAKSARHNQRNNQSHKSSSSSWIRFTVNLWSSEITFCFTSKTFFGVDGNMHQLNDLWPSLSSIRAVLFFLKLLLIDLRLGLWYNYPYWKKVFIVVNLKCHEMILINCCTVC